MKCSKCNQEITPEKRIDVKGREDECYDCYRSSPRKTVCVDLDGVLAQYTGWKGPDHIGAPMPGAREFLKSLNDMGHEVVIHTTRDKHRVAEWMLKRKMIRLISDITNEKPPAVAYIDDRALTFQGDFRQTLAQLCCFTPWWKPTCSNCANLEDGVCYECAGENYGHATKCSPKGHCDNWRKE